MIFVSRRRPQIATTLGLAAASAAVAAAAVYFLDPSSGKRRRSSMYERVAHAGRESRDFAARLGRDTYKRATGMYKRSRRHLHSVGDRVPF